MKFFSFYFVVTFGLDRFLDTSAFRHGINLITGRNSRCHPLCMSSVDDEVAALRAKAAELRAEADEAAKDINTSKGKIETEKVSKVVTEKEVLNSLASKEISFEDDDAEFQASRLDDLLESGELSFWKAAIRGSANSDVQSPLRNYPVTLGLMSTRSGGLLTGESLGVVNGEKDINMSDFLDVTIAVTLTSTVLAIASLKFLPQNTGATVCYLFALVPIVYLAIGSTSPGIIAGASKSFNVMFTTNTSFNNFYI